MARELNTVVRKASRLTKDRTKALLASGLHRAAAARGLDEIALAGGCTTRCIEKALAHDTLPGLDIVLNVLTADATILDELLAAFGLRLSALHAEAANDLMVAGGIIDAMGKLVSAHADGHRDHNETLSIAALLRPHLPAIEAIVLEADELRGFG